MKIMEASVNPEFFVRANNTGKIVGLVVQPTSSLMSFKSDSVERLLELRAGITGSSNIAIVWLVIAERLKRMRMVMGRLSDPPAKPFMQGIWGTPARLSPMNCETSASCAINLNWYLDNVFLWQPHPAHDLRDSQYV